jgi:hypothetical protein
MKYKARSEGWSQHKKAKRGFRGYPIAPVAFLGPTNEFASKMVIGFRASEEADTEIERWFSQDGKDVRFDPVPTPAAQVARSALTGPGAIASRTNFFQNRRFSNAAPDPKESWPQINADQRR